MTGLGVRLGLAGSPEWLAASVFAIGSLGASAEALWVALPEELVFRGLLQGEIGARSGRAGWAVVVAAVAFALAHLPTAGVSGLWTLGPGLLFGWLRARSGSLWPAVAAHAAANALWAAWAPGGMAV